MGPRRTVGKLPDAEPWVPAQAIELHASHKQRDRGALREPAVLRRAEEPEIACEVEEHVVIANPGVLGLSRRHVRAHGPPRHAWRVPLRLPGMDEERHLEPADQDHDGERGQRRGRPVGRRGPAGQQVQHPGCAGTDQQAHERAGARARHHQGGDDEAGEPQHDWQRRTQSQDRADDPLDVSFRAGGRRKCRGHCGEEAHAVARDEDVPRPGLRIQPEEHRGREDDAGEPAADTPGGSPVLAERAKRGDHGRRPPRQEHQRPIHGEPDEMQEIPGGKGLPRRAGAAQLPEPRVQNLAPVEAGPEPRCPQEPRQDGHRQPQGVGGMRQSTPVALPRHEGQDRDVEKDQGRGALGDVGQREQDPRDQPAPLDPRAGTGASPPRRQGGEHEQREQPVDLPDRALVQHRESGEQEERRQVAGEQWERIARQGADEEGAAKGGERGRKAHRPLVDFTSERADPGHRPEEPRRLVDVWPAVEGRDRVVPTVPHGARRCRAAPFLQAQRTHSEVRQVRQGPDSGDHDPQPGTRAQQGPPRHCTLPTDPSHVGPGGPRDGGGASPLVPHTVPLPWCQDILRIP